MTSQTDIYNPLPSMGERAVINIGRQGHDNEIRHVFYLTKTIVVTMKVTSIFGWWSTGRGSLPQGHSTPSAPRPECEQSRQCWPLSPKNGSDHISNWMTSNTNGAFLFVSMLPRTQQETTDSPKYTLLHRAYKVATFMVSGKLPLAVWHFFLKYL